MTASRAVAINGSPRKDRGYTALVLGAFLEGMTDAEARRVLTEAGLPAFEGAAIRLEALDEVGLPQFAPDDLSTDAVPGEYYKIGTWGAGDLVLHGAFAGIWCNF